MFPCMISKSTSLVLGGALLALSTQAAKAEWLSILAAKDIAEAGFGASTS